MAQGSGAIWRAQRRAAGGSLAGPKRRIGASLGIACLLPTLHIQQRIRNPHTRRASLPHTFAPHKRPSLSAASNSGLQTARSTVIAHRSLQGAQWQACNPRRCSRR